MCQMGNNSLLFKCCITLFIFFHCLLCVICQNCTGPSCGRGAPSPTSPPGGNLTFEDRRIAVVYQVIQDFKKKITEDPQGITKTWVGPNICKGYTGFYCDNPPDNASAVALASIDFNGYNLAAPTLEGFIDRFPDLALFHANSNNFTGIIPSNISKLPYFYELDLSNNDFSGEFPQSVFGIKDLAFLDIRFNGFSGTVPAQIFVQPLEVLFINNNKFLQKLPDNLGNTPVFYLTFANNRFTGPIPPSIGNASETLIEVLFLNNKLSGCLPYEIGLLKEATVFDAGNNLLTGPLPFSLSCLEKIEQLNFAGNLLYGQVPEVVCELGSLLNLSLSDNYFSIIGPTCKKLVDSGVLDLRKNCIHGLPEQRSATECWWFSMYRNHWPCQYPPWYTTCIPCKAPSHPVHGHQHPRPKLGSKRKLLSYAALSRHGL
ncbi:uncharacterized protein At4g06744-like [Carya illinoinensis]|uniref:Uncharacterized protein n=1 Tax=Carya illinoinensis TaxID=32201 RepID=A0A8T1QD21_CARIL|nr:uncharacterized protein At4g06744-like [Carya illinoinensis]KAG6652480.1 hypothetical protein CIPAW_05G009100 [Carya illinoinensis]